jgi:hypothetical protein
MAKMNMIAALNSALEHQLERDENLALTVFLTPRSLKGALQRLPWEWD